MVSLKLTAAQREGGTLCCPDVAGDAPLYPYGTELRLEDEQLTLLGITALPPVGTKFAVIAIAEVVDTSARENKEGKENCLSLQITDMQLDATGESFGEKADKFYKPVA